MYAAVETRTVVVGATQVERIVSVPPTQSSACGGRSSAHHAPPEGGATTGRGRSGDVGRKAKRRRSKEAPAASCVACRLASHASACATGVFCFAAAFSTGVWPDWLRAASAAARDAAHTSSPYSRSSMISGGPSKRCSGVSPTASAAPRSALAPHRPSRYLTAHVSRDATAQCSAVRPYLSASRSSDGSTERSAPSTETWPDIAAKEIAFRPSLERRKRASAPPRTRARTSVASPAAEAWRRGFEGSSMGSLQRDDESEDERSRRDGVLVASRGCRASKSGDKS